MTPSLGRSKRRRCRPRPTGDHQQAHATGRDVNDDVRLVDGQDPSMWVDRRVRSSDGDSLGITVGVHVHGDLPHPVWLIVDTGTPGTPTVVAPARGSSLLGDDIVIRADRDTVLTAPTVNGLNTMDPADARSLVDHYTAPHLRDRRPVPGIRVVSTPERPGFCRRCGGPSANARPRRGDAHRHGTPVLTNLSNPTIQILASGVDEITTPSPLRWLAAARHLRVATTFAASIRASCLTRLGQGTAPFSVSCEGCQGARTAATQMPRRPPCYPSSTDVTRSRSAAGPRPGGPPGQCFVTNHH